MSRDKNKNKSKNTNNIMWSSNMNNNPHWDPIY